MSATFQIAPLWNRASVRQSIFRAAVSVTAAGVVVKSLGLFKEIAIASVYGRTDALDAFLAAALIPSLLVNLISESLNQALVPTLIRVQEQEGHASAQRLFSCSMLWICLLLIVVSAAMGLSAKDIFPVIASHYPQAKMDLAVQMFFALLPLVLMSGIATQCTAVLNTLHRFLLPALAPLMISVAMIISVVLMGRRCGIWAMVYGNLVGALIHAALVAYMLHGHGYKILPRWLTYHPAAPEVIRQYGAVFLSGVVSSGGLLVDQAMAASLPAGSVSALAYASRFVSVVLTLLAGAVSTAIMPHFSRMIAQRNWPQCRHTLRSWLAITALVSVPLTIALIACAHGLIRATLQRGAFGAGDTVVVTSVLVMYSIQIPFYVCSRVCYRFVLSMLRADLILYCGVLNLILDIVLNVVLMRSMGIAGIALATSLWTVSTFLFLFYWAGRLLRRAIEDGRYTSVQS